MSIHRLLAFTVTAALTFSAIAHADTVVTLSFDDTLTDQQQAATILQASGLRGTFYINSSRLGQAGFMTLAQALMIQTAGHEIGGHTINHLTLGLVPEEEEARQICDDRAALLSMGFSVTSLAYPHGTAPGATQLVASMCGYNSARNVSGLRAHAPESCTGCPYVETIPPATMMGIRTPGSVKANQLATDLEQNVLDAEARGGGWVPFVIHHVCDGCNTDAISPAVLQELVTWLAARQAMGTTVKTVQEVVGGAVQPAVIAPAAIAYAAPDGNLLRNSDLETFTNTGDLPDCIMSLTGGANGADYTVGLAPSSHSGTRAAQISFLPGKTGTPRIASLQDLGYCSPPAKTGDPLVFSFYYQATDAVAPVAYYRIASGWWKTLAQGPALVPAATWTASEWTLPALPADAVAVSVGVTLLNTGTLAVDDFRLINLNGPPPQPDMAGTPGGDGGTSSPDGGTPPPDAGAIPSVDGGTGDLATGESPGGCSMAPASTGGPALLIAMFLLALVVLRPGRR